jgi:hypothetical protein
VPQAVEAKPLQAYRSGGRAPHSPCRPAWHQPSQEL